MAQLLVRNLEDTVKRKLQRRAARHGRSMEEEVREILRRAAREKDPPEGGWGSEIAALFAGRGVDHEIPKLQIKLKPPSFDE